MIICDFLLRMTAFLLHVGGRRQCVYAFYFLQQKVEVGEEILFSSKAL